jgi:hypothetical protein
MMGINDNENVDIDDLKIELNTLIESEKYFEAISNDLKDLV